LYSCKSEQKHPCKPRATNEQVAILTVDVRRESLPSVAGFMKGLENAREGDATTPDAVKARFFLRHWPAKKMTGTNVQGSLFSSLRSFPQRMHPRAIVCDIAARNSHDSVIRFTACPRISATNPKTTSFMSHLLRSKKKRRKWRMWARNHEFKGSTDKDAWILTSYAHEAGVE
jgi:hypothetical protein